MESKNCLHYQHKSDFRKNLRAFRKLQKLSRFYSKEKKEKRKETQ